MSVKATKEQRVKETEEEEISEDLDLKVKKYLRGGAANFDDLKDKKLKGQLSHREFLHGASAKAAAKYEKVCTFLFSLSICCCISENDDVGVHSVAYAEWGRVFGGGRSGREDMENQTGRY